MTIQEAYGIHYETNKEHIDDRGWTYWYVFDWGGIFEKMEVQHQGICWRPNVLRDLYPKGPVMFDYLNKDKE